MKDKHKSNKYKKTKIRALEANESDTSEYQPLTFNDVWRMFQETDRQFRETDRKISKLNELFTSQWGKLMESLVEGDLIHLLNQQGIEVHRSFRNVESREPAPGYEFDIVAENGHEVVFVEVKTTLRSEDIKHFVNKLKKVKTWIPKYNPYCIYGAVAFLQTDKNCIRMAEKKGLMVIRATGNSASIINGKGFKPRSF